MINSLPGSVVAWLTAKLAVQTDVSDVQAALANGEPGFTLIDTRSLAAFRQGHIPGAIHLPTAVIPIKADR